MISSLQRGELSSERLSNFSEVTQLINGRGWVWAQQPDFEVYALYLQAVLLPAMHLPTMCHPTDDNTPR